MQSRLSSLRTLLTHLRPLCFVALFCCSPSAQSQLRNTSSVNLGSTASNGTFSGVVINAVSGLPIPRALVQWTDRAVLTDHEGKFAFDQADGSSPINLQVNKPGFYASPEGDTVANISLPGQIGAPVTVRLFPESLLAGTLTAADGTPLPRVLVTAQRSFYNESGHQWNPSGQNPTNSRGEFRIAVPPGDYKVETGYLPRFAGSSNSVIPSIYPAVTSSETSGTIHLVAGAEEHLSLHPEVAPTYPVSLQIDQTGERNFPMISARSSTGALIPVSFMRFQPGSGSKIELPLGTYTLTASMNMGEATEYGESSVTVTGQNTPEVTLRMASVPAIPVDVMVDQGSGSTSDKAPTPAQLGLMLNSVQQSVLRRGNSSVGVVQARDRSYLHALPGTYRLVSRSMGPWFIKSAFYGATDLLQQDLVIAQGSGSSPIALTVSNQTGSLQGTAKLNGIPSSVWVYLVPTGPAANAIYSVRSSPAGVFNYAYLPPGSYQVIGFELRHPENYRDPEVLAKYTTYTHNVTITSGNKATLDLDAVTAAGMLP